MRAISIAIVRFSASIVVVDIAEAQGGIQIVRGHVLQAPVGHRQPTKDEVEGDDQFAETGLARTINKENQMLDRALKGICRGC
jgi:hypothetical protein